MQPGSAILSASPWQAFGTLRVREVRYRPHAVQQPHRHEESSLSLVLAGEIEETSSTESFQAAAGSVVVKPAACWHSNRYGPRGAHLVQVRLNAANGSLEPEFHRYGWLDSPWFVGAVLNLLNGRTKARESAEMYFWDVVESFLPGRTRQPIMQPDWLADALDLLDASSEHSISVTEVATRVGVHPVHLARVVRARYGCSVRQYIRERRVLAAWRACQAGDQSLAAIAAGAGFADQAHMTRAFTEILGVSPGQLKRLGLGAINSR